MNLRERSDAGTTTVELVLLAPLLLALLCFTAAGGRITQAEAQLEGAARDAARAASIERSPQAARAAASRTAAGNISFACAPLTVVADVRDFRPGGTVTVTVRCTASLAGLGLAGFPGRVTLTGRAVAPLDQYRGLP
jgi:Flp pilus assembly protein TadG